jgi:uncharacterized protein
VTSTVGEVATKLRIFPLDTVLFPGMRLTVHVIEPRLREMIRTLAKTLGPSDRRLGVVAIREGYRIGRSHGRQSAHRVGCEALMTQAKARPDGSWDIALMGRRRMRVEELVSEGRASAVAAVTYPPEIEGPDAPMRMTTALGAFEAYRNTVADNGGAQVPLGDLPTEALALSYALATATTLPLRERQVLLEAPHAAARLQRLTLMLRVELSAIQAVASLPATRLARTNWSPN